MSSVGGEPVIDACDAIRLVCRAWIRPVFFVRGAIHVFRACPARCQKEETRVVRMRQLAVAGIASLSGHADYRRSSVACAWRASKLVFPAGTRIFSVVDGAWIDAFSCVERGCNRRGRSDDSYFERGLDALAYFERGFATPRGEKYRFPSDGRRPEQAIGAFSTSYRPILQPENGPGYRFSGVAG